MMAAPPLTWDPVRKGDLYCSPACGMGCTWIAHERVEAQAETLARAMGAGWEPRVWENTGWNWSIDAAGGLISLRESGRGYIVFVSPEHPHAGRWVGRGSTPRVALHDALAMADTEIALISGITSTLRELASPESVSSVAD